MIAAVRRTTADEDDGPGFEYLKFLRDISKEPESSKFVYLKRVDHHSMAYNPYMLQMVPYQEADPQELYTLSPKGITLTWADGQGSDLTPPQRWEKECTMFRRLKRQRLFRDFHGYKPFRLWRRAIRLDKMRHSSHRLEKAAFVLLPATQTGLSAIAKLCSTASTIRLHALQRGQPLHLGALKASLDAACSSASLQLTDFVGEAARVVAAACQQTMSDLHARLEAFTQQQEETQASMTSSQTTRRGLPDYLTSSHAHTAQDFSFTRGATDRNETRTLARFVRVADFLVLNALREVIRQSMQELLQAIEGRQAQAAAPAEPFQGTDDVVTAPEESAPPPGNSVIQLELRQAHGGMLEMSPSFGEVQTFLGELLEQWQEAISGLPRVSEASELSGFMAAAQAAGAAPALSPLQSLVGAHFIAELPVLLQEGMQAAWERAVAVQQEVEPVSAAIRATHQVDSNALVARYYSSTAATMCSIVPGASPSMSPRAASTLPGSTALTGAAGAREAGGHVTVADFHSLLNNLHEQQRQCNQLPDQVEAGLFQVRLPGVKGALRKASEAHLARLSEELPPVAARLASDLSIALHATARRLTQVVDSPGDYADQLSLLNTLQERSEQLQACCAEVEALRALVDTHSMAMGDLDKTTFLLAATDLHRLQQAMADSQALRPQQVALFQDALALEGQAAAQAAAELRAAVGEGNMDLDAAQDADVMAARLADLQRRAVVAAQAAARVASHENIFGVQQTDFGNVQVLTQELDARLQLWQAVRAWEDAHAAWELSPISGLDLAGVAAQLQDFQAAADRLEAILPPNAVCEQRLRAAGRGMQELLPVLEALQNAYLKAAHWQRLQGVLQLRGISSAVDLRLPDLVAAQASTHAKTIIGISVSATREAELRVQYEDTRTRALALDLPLSHGARDAWALGDTEDLAAGLDACLATLAAVLASQYAYEVQGEAEDLVEKLHTAVDLLELWTASHGRVTMLAALFHAPEVSQLLPTQAKALALLEKRNRGRLRDARLAPQMLTVISTPGLADALRQDLGALEALAPHLDDCLEMRRIACPRLYRLSDADLLGLLARCAEDPLGAVQQHVGKMFPGIAHLELAGESGKAEEIRAIVSPEGEHVALARAAKVQGEIETWLPRLEEDIRLTMHRAVRTASKANQATWEEQEKLLEQVPVQAALLGQQLQFCRKVEAALASAACPARLEALLKESESIVAQLRLVIRNQQLSGVLQSFVVSAVASQISNKSIITRLQREGVQDPSHPAWQNVLRYAFSQTGEELFVLQGTAKLPYAFEYLGVPASHVAVTQTMGQPTLLAMMNALHLRLVPAVVGCQGCSKSDSVAALACALGQSLVTVDAFTDRDGASQSHAARIMSRHIAGASQTGTWLCINECDRLGGEVASHLAQQLATAASALKAGYEHLNLDGRQISLHPCSFFVTLAADKAEEVRQHLGAMQASFKLVAVPELDPVVLAELQLTCQGFGDVEAIASKLAPICRLAATLQAPPAGSGFNAGEAGNAAVLAVVHQAAALRRRLGSHQATESGLVACSLGSLVLPGLELSQAAAFERQLQKAFPGDDALFKEAKLTLRGNIKAALTSRGLQAPPAFVAKAAELARLLQARRGIVLVGQSAAGKSCCLQAVQDACSAGDCSIGMAPMEMHAFNPASAGPAEVWGGFMPGCATWRDGLITSCLRQLAADSSGRIHVLVLDGSVDQQTAANVSSVLAENRCALSLPNGESIRLNPACIRVVFEVADLADVPPATAMHCSTIVVPVGAIGWRSVARSCFHRAFPQTEQAAIKEHLLALTRCYLEKGCAYLRQHHPECAAALPMAALGSIVAMLQSLVQGDRQDCAISAEADDWQAQLQHLFVFAIVWCIGGAIPPVHRPAFDGFVRATFASLTGSLPANGQLFEYDVVTGGGQTAFCPWTEQVPQASNSADVPAKDAFVPTAEAACLQRLLQAWTGAGQGVFIEGTPASGKSCSVKHAAARQGVGHCCISLAGARPVDDVTLAGIDANEADLELLRKVLDRKGFHDFGSQQWQSLANTAFVAVANAQGQATHSDLPSRLKRHCAQLILPKPSTASTHAIITSALLARMQGCAEDVRAAVAPLAKASIAALEQLGRLLPVSSPETAHYTWGLHEVFRQVEGVLQAVADVGSNVQSLYKLWLHEGFRVFADRLVSTGDVTTFRRLLARVLTSHWRPALQPADLQDTVIFARQEVPASEDGSEPSTVYQQVSDVAAAAQSMQVHQEQYNVDHPTAPLRLIFFPETTRHVLHIIRALQQPCGNALVLGPAGVGKRSMCSFAACFGGMACSPLVLPQDAPVADFRRQLKAVYLQAGLEARPTLLYVPDLQACSDPVIRDISMILNGVEIPGLLCTEDSTRITAALQEAVASTGATAGQAACHSLFLKRVRANLHCLLVATPWPAWQARTQRFPALLSATQQLWVGSWSAPSLQALAQQHLVQLRPELDAGTASKLAALCVDLHSAACRADERVSRAQGCRRQLFSRKHITMLELCVATYNHKYAEFSEKITNLRKCLKKLDQMRSDAEATESQLANFESNLEAKQQAAKDAREAADAQQPAVEEAHREVSAAEADLQDCTAKLQALNGQVSAELAEVTPQMEAAQAGVAALTEKDIVELRHIASPHASVLLAVQAVAALKGIEVSDWPPAQKMLADHSFLGSLASFDKGNISDAAIRQLRKCTEQPECSQEAAAEHNKAAGSLCKWAVAVAKHHEAMHTVAPLQEAAGTAEQAVKDATEKLDASKAKAKAAEERHASLEAAVEAAQKDCMSSLEQKDSTQIRLQQARQLIRDLSSEDSRWESDLSSVQAQNERLVGSVAAASAAAVYSGALGDADRQDLLQEWRQAFSKHAVKASSGSVMQETLSTPAQVRQWHSWGLPRDPVCIDNAIIISTCQQWPLLVDPHGLATSWLRHLEPALQVLRAGKPDCLSSLQQAVSAGKPILLQDIHSLVSTGAGAALLPLLYKQLRTIEDRTIIQLGDQETDYNPSFRLYLQSQDSAVDLPAELAASTCVTWWGVTPKACEEHLLQQLLARERPELEDTSLSAAICQSEQSLQAASSQIQRLLCDASGHALEDASLVKSLLPLAASAAKLQAAQTEQQESMSQLTDKRDAYRPAAAWASRIYKVVESLHTLNATYQASLPRFAEALQSCIPPSEAPSSQSARLATLRARMAGGMLAHLQRGMLRHHRLPLAAALCQASAAGSQGQEWQLLLQSSPPASSEASASDVSAHHAPSWLTSGMQEAISRLEVAVPAVAGLAGEIVEAPRDWEAWYGAPAPETERLPRGWQDRLDGLQKVLLVKALRSDRTCAALHAWTQAHLGATQLPGSSQHISEAASQAHPHTPLILLTGPGEDAGSALRRAGEAKGLVTGRTLLVHNLGEGQLHAAEASVLGQASVGGWVCLANCHLASAWMPRLEALVAELASMQPAPNPSFRLWLSCPASAPMPGSVARAGIPVALQSAWGLRGILQDIFAQMSPEPFSHPGQGALAAWPQILLRLSLFHALLLERTRIAPHIWRAAPHFTQADLEASMAVVQQLLQGRPAVPWPSIQQALAEVTYGSHTSHQHDRHQLQILAQRICHDGPIDGLPAELPAGELPSFRAWVDVLPEDAVPNLLGLESSVVASYGQQQSHRLVQDLQALQLQEATDEAALSAIQGMLDRMPARPQSVHLNADQTVSSSNSEQTALLQIFATVLEDEVAACSALVDEVSTSLTELLRQYQGSARQSPELQQLALAIQSNTVPDGWQKLSFPFCPSAGLSSWLTSLANHADFLRQSSAVGAASGSRPVWLGGFFFPERFLAACLRQYASANGATASIPCFKAQVNPDTSAADTAGAVCISGLQIVGAQWGSAERHLIPSPSAKHACDMPSVLLEPCSEQHVPDAVSLPLYAVLDCSAREASASRGARWIADIYFADSSSGSASDWVLQGAALSCCHAYES